MLSKIKEIKYKFLHLMDGCASIFSIFKKKKLINLLQNFKTNIFSELREMSEKISDLQKTNLELALYHFANGNWSDAIMRFKIVRKLWKCDDPRIDYYIARAFFLKKKYNESRIFLDAYNKSCNTSFLTEAAFLYKMLDNDCADLTYIPIKMIKEKRNAQMNSDLSKRVLRKISKRNGLIIEILDEIIPFINHHQNIETDSDNKLSLNTLNCLEIGCGRGNLGIVLKKFLPLQRLVGMDFSEISVEKKANKLFFIEDSDEKTSSYQLRNRKIKTIVYNQCVLDPTHEKISEVYHNDQYKIVVFSSVLNNYANPIEMINLIDKSDIILALIYCVNHNTKITSVSNKVENIEYFFNIHNEKFIFSQDYIEKLLQENGWYILRKEDLETNSIDEREAQYAYLLTKNLQLVQDIGAHDQ